MLFRVLGRFGLETSDTPMSVLLMVMGGTPVFALALTLAPALELALALALLASTAPVPSSHTDELREECETTEEEEGGAMENTEGAVGKEKVEGKDDEECGVGVFFGDSMFTIAFPFAFAFAFPFALRLPCAT